MLVVLTIISILALSSRNEPVDSVLKVPHLTTLVDKTYTEPYAVEPSFMINLTKGQNFTANPPTLGQPPTSYAGIQVFVDIIDPNNLHIFNSTTDFWSYTGQTGGNWRAELNPIFRICAPNSSTRVNVTGTYTFTYSTDPPNSFVHITVTSYWVEIRIIPPTNLSLSLISSISYVGFKIGIIGNLTSTEKGVSGIPVLLPYSVTAGESWNDITLVDTTSDGEYSAVWMPQATGNYLVKATWTGNETYSEASTIVNLDVTSSEGTNIFPVESNSTISALAFNKTSSELGFNVTGTTGTSGYTKLFLAKSLVSSTANVRVYLDGNQASYLVGSQEDAWMLTFIYTHSTHHFTVDLKTAIAGKPLDLRLIYVIIAVAAAIFIGGIILVKRRKPKSEKSTYTPSNIGKQLGYTMKPKIFYSL